MGLSGTERGCCAESQYISVFQESSLNTETSTVRTLLRIGCLAVQRKRKCSCGVDGNDSLPNACMHSAESSPNPEQAVSVLGKCCHRLSGEPVHATAMLSAGGRVESGIGSSEYELHKLLLSSARSHRRLASWQFSAALWA